MNQETHIATFLLACLIAALGTPLARRLALRLGAQDDPSRDTRRVHGQTVPRLGGLAIAFGFLVPVCGLLFLHLSGLYENRITAALLEDEGRLVGLLVGALAILGLGMYDDIRGVGARKKLVVQCLVAAGMYASGFRFESLSNPFGEPFELGLFALPFTVLWLVGIMNAVNLIDGLDGLAGGLTLISISTVFLVCFVHDKILICLFCTALAGALLGFLYHNFHPATIFMGDTGSLFIGLVLGLVSIDSSKTTTTAALAIPVLALGVPIMDTLLSMARRLLTGRDPFKADRGHVHHRLLAKGLSQRQVVLLMYGMGVVFALMAVSIEAGSRLIAGLVLALAGLFAVVILRGLGYDRMILKRFGVSNGRGRRRRQRGAEKAGIVSGTAGGSPSARGAGSGSA